MADLAELTIKISSESVEPADRKLKELDKTGSRTERTFLALTKIIDLLEKQIKQAAGASAAHTTALHQEGTAASVASKQIETMTAAEARRAAASRVSLAQLNLAGVSAAKLTAEDNKLAEANNKLVGAQGKAGDAAASMGAKTTLAGRALRQITGLFRALVPMMLGFAAAGGAVALVFSTFRSLAQYERALVGVGKTTDIAGAELKALGAEFIQLSGRIPVAASELLALGQAAGQLGVRGTSNLLKFAETVARLGEASAGTLQGEQAALTLARMLSLAGEGADKVDVLANVIVRLGNNMAATEGEIAEVALRLSQATSIFRLSSAQVAAVGAAMRAAGVEAELGGNAVGRILFALDEAVRKGGPMLQTVLELTRMTREEFKELQGTDPFQAFLATVQGLGRMGRDASVALEKLGLDNIRVRASILPLAANYHILSDAVDLATDEVEKNNAAIIESDRAFGTLSLRWQALKNSITAAQLELEGSTGTLSKIVDTVGDMIRVFSGARIEGEKVGGTAITLASGLKAVAVAMTLLVAIKLGTMLGMLALRFATAAADAYIMAAGIGTVGAASATTSTSVALLSAATKGLTAAFATNPITAWAVALAALVSVLVGAWSWVKATRAEAEGFIASLVDLTGTIEGMVDARIRLEKARETGNITATIRALEELVSLAQTADVEIDKALTRAEKKGEPPVFKIADLPDLVPQVDIEGMVFNMRAKLIEDFEKVARDQGAAAALTEALATPFVKANDALRAKLEKMQTEVGDELSGLLYSTLDIGGRALPRDFLPKELFDDFSKSVRSVELDFVNLNDVMGSNQNSLQTYSAELEELQTKFGRTGTGFAGGMDGVGPSEDQIKALREARAELGQLSSEMAFEQQMLGKSAQERERATLIRKVEEMALISGAAALAEHLHLLDEEDRAAVLAYNSIEELTRSYGEQIDELHRLQAAEEARIKALEKLQEASDALKAQTKALKEQFDSLTLGADRFERLRGAQEAFTAAQVFGIQVAVGFAVAADQQIAKLQELREAVEDLRKAEAARNEVIRLVQDVEFEIDTAGLDAAEQNIQRNLENFKKAADAAFGKDAQALVTAYEMRLRRLQVLQDIRAFAESFGATIARGLEDAVFELDNLQQAAENVIKSISRLIFQELVGKPVQESIADLVAKARAPRDKLPEAELPALKVPELPEMGLDFGVLNTAATTLGTGATTLGTSATTLGTSATTLGTAAGAMNTSAGLLDGAAAALKGAAAALGGKGGGLPIPGLPGGGGGSGGGGGGLDLPDAQFAGGAFGAGAGKLAAFSHGAAFESSSMMQQFARRSRRMTHLASGGALMAGRMMHLASGGALLAGRLTHLSAGGAINAGRLVHFDQGGMLDDRFGLPKEMLDMERAQHFAFGGLPRLSNRVISEPTFFPMAGGRTGVLAEKEPEAVMPLRKTSSGRLGVEIAGGRSGGNVVNNNVSKSLTINVATPNAESFKRSERQLAAQAKRLMN